MIETAVILGVGGVLSTSPEVVIHKGVQKEPSTLLSSVHGFYYI